MEGLIIFAIVFWIIPIFIAANVWENKGGGKGAGVALGLFLGWLGVLIAAIATPSNAVKQQRAGSTGLSAAQSRECPFCKSSIRRDASVCPHCQRESAPWVYHEGRWWTKGTDGKDYYLDGVTGRWAEHQPQLPSSNEPAKPPAP